MTPNDDDRRAAWPWIDWHCLPDNQMRERFFAGYYDAGSPLFPPGDVIQAFAAHRLASERRAYEKAARVATSFLVGDPANGVPLRNPMAHDIAAAIRALAGEG